MFVEDGVVFSKAVNGPSARLIPKHVIAAKVADTPLGAGGTSRPAGVIGRPSQGGCVGVNNTGVIGNVARRRRSQLAWRWRARVSAQAVVRKIFWNGCATGLAVTSALS